MTGSDGERRSFDVVVGDASALTDWAWSQARDEGTVVRLVRGAKMRTFAAAYDELAAALQLPYYFGENLDALEECLTDLEWLPGPRHLLLVRDADLLLADESDADVAMSSLLTVLARAQSVIAPTDGESPTDEWHRGAPISVILHATTQTVPRLRARLVDAGFTAVERPLA